MLTRMPTAMFGYPQLPRTLCMPKLLITQGGHGQATFGVCLGASAFLHVMTKKGFKHCSRLSLQRLCRVACSSSKAGRYMWEQDANEITIIVPIGPNVQAGDVFVQVEATSLKLCVQESEPVVDGQLWAAVDPMESCWNIEDVAEERAVVVKLHKLKPQTIWEHPVYPMQHEIEKKTQQHPTERGTDEAVQESTTSDKHDSEQRIIELMKLPQSPFSPQHIGTCWEDYFANRGLAPRNIAACTGALSVPLTILAGFLAAGVSLAPEETLLVDLPGSRVLELTDLELVYAELGRAFPGRPVRLRMVGPELGRGLPCGRRRLQIDNVCITFHKRLYQDFLSKGRTPPHFAVAFHAGIQMHASWPPALHVLASLGIPTVVTAYSLTDAVAGLRQLRHCCSWQPHIIKEGVNHFACSERLIVDERTESVRLAEGLSAAEGQVDRVLQTARRDEEDVVRAGGLEQLESRVGPERSEIVAINSWWYIFRGVDR